jgi:hypothetical protein
VRDCVTVFRPSHFGIFDPPTARHMAQPRYGPERYRANRFGLRSVAMYCCTSIHAFSSLACGCRWLAAFRDRLPVMACHTKQPQILVAIDTLDIVPVAHWPWYVVIYVEVAFVPTDQYAAITTLVHITQCNPLACCLPPCGAIWSSFCCGASGFVI